MTVYSKTIAFLIACVLIMGWFIQPVAAQSFKEANQFYKENKYDQAIAAYEKISQAGFESANLYYNLGNSYCKKGQIGRALLNYERAKIFMPHDGDLRSNYDFVKSVLNVPVRYSCQPWFFRWLDRLFDGIGMNMLTMIVSALWILILVLLSASLFLPAIRQISPLLNGILAVMLIVCSLALARKAYFYQHGAIITDREVEAKFEPQVGATTYFKVFEGNSVLILDRTAGWVKVRRPDGKIGWVAALGICAIR